MQTGRSSVAAVESRYRLRSVATPHGIYSGVMLMSRKPLVLFLQFGFYVVAGCDNAPTVIEALPAIAESPSQDFTSHSTVGALQAQRDTRLLCSSDADCFHTGCFGQLCASQGIVTSCEFRCEYACYQQAACSCIGGRCGSRIAPELITCFRECGAPPNPFPLPPPPRSSDARAGGGLDGVDPIF